MPVDPGKAQLDRWYNLELLSYAGIAERLGCSRTWVGQLMARHGLSARSLSVAHKVAVGEGRPPGWQSGMTEKERRERGRKWGLDAQRRYRKRHPERVRAQWRLSKAVRDGRVERPDRCQDCDKRCKPQGYMKDPQQALEVDWLCRVCHMKRRRVEAARRGR